jgi:hypothetical protein
MTILIKTMKCAVCGEVMAAGTHARFETFSYPVANGAGYRRNAKPRIVARHEGLCPKQREADYREALEGARYHHEAALGHMFRGNMDKAKVAFSHAHTKIKIAKRLKSA